MGSLSPWQSKTGVRALAGDSCGAWDASGRYPLMDTTPASSCALRSAMIDAAPPCPTWHEMVRQGLAASRAGEALAAVTCSSVPTQMLHSMHQTWRNPVKQACPAAHTCSTMPLVPVRPCPLHTQTSDRLACVNQVRTDIGRRMLISKLF